MLAVGASILLGACGGQKRQDEDEPRGRYEVEVSARFPEKQKLAKRSDLVITVRNAGSKTIPNVAATIEGFSEREQDPGLADPDRPVFVINGVQRRIGDYPEAKQDDPKGCETAYTSTWGCGRLKPGAERTFKWGVTAVEAGPFRIKWTIAAGLDGKAKAVDAEGTRPTGVFSGTISDTPPDARVADDGESIVGGTR